MLFLWKKCLSSFFSPPFSLSYFPLLSIASWRCDIWIREKPYEQNKRAYCKAEMNGVSLLLLSTLTSKSLASSCSGNFSGLICFFVSFITPSLISVLLWVHRAGCQQGHLVLASYLTAGKWHYQGPIGFLCSFKPQHSLCVLLAIFPMDSFKVYF